MPRAPTRDNASGWKPDSACARIDQFLRNALFPQSAFDHFAVTATALQRMLQDVVSVRSGKIIDVGGHRVSKHQRQLGMCGFDLGFGLGLHVGINRRRDLVGFVNRRGLGFLLRRRIVRLQGRQFRTVHGFENAFQFVLHPLIRADFGRALQQLIHRAIKTPLGCFQISSFEFFLRRLIFLLGVRNQIDDRIGFGLSGLGVLSDAGFDLLWFGEGRPGPGTSCRALAWGAGRRACACRCGRPCWPGLRPGRHGAQSEG